MYSRRPVYIAVLGVLAFLLFFSTERLVVCQEPENVDRRYMIELGWDIPTTDYISRNWREMEQDAPFDGVIYDLVSSKSGASDSSQSMFTARKWNRDELQKAIDDLNSCAFERYQHNFIRVNFHPCDFGWNDDAAWEAVCEKAAICAWVARQTRGGICLDFESYGAAIFRYSASWGFSFDDAREFARRRGAQFCSAISKEFPGATILCLWMNSINASAGRSSSPSSLLRDGYYGLLPSFIDGMLDAAPDDMRFVDGCENGYYMNGVEEYQRAALDMTLRSGPCATLVSPENRDKYRAQVEAGFGFYLDMYSNPPESHYYRGPEPGETRFDRLRANLEAAWNATDQYVWVYGEQKRWWRPDGAKSDDEWTSWEEALPGLTQLVLNRTRPTDALKTLKEKCQDNESDNLLLNGKFQKDGAPSQESWNFWNREDSVGEYSADADGAVIKGHSDACFLQGIKVDPRARYFIMGKIKTQGSVSARLTARWQDEDQRWVSQDRDVRMVAFEGASPDEQGFVDVFGVAEVPSDARRLVLLLGASCERPEDAASFTDVRVYAVDANSP